MVDKTTESETSTEADTIIEDDKAESSTPESETEADLLSVIKDAAQPEEEPESHSEAEEVERDEVAAESTESNADVEFADPEEDYSNLPFHKHPRFKELVQQRNEAKESAEKFDIMQSYLADNNLSGDEAAAGLDIMAKMKSDPMAALKALQPYVQQLSQAAGIIVPDDIQSKVDDGYLDESAARELTRSRADAAWQKQQNAALMQQQQYQAQQDQVDYLSSVANEWEENARANDPDYDLKEDLIDARVQALRWELGSNGQKFIAQTPEQLRELAQTAYHQVNEKYNAKFGNKTPMKTASGGKLGGSPAPEPQSLQEAIAAAMGNS
jgi:hypothetical protein